MTLVVSGSIEVGGFRVDLDLEVARGETVALVGPNGAGKSTIVRAIAGLQSMTSGRIALDDTTWDGKEMFVPPERRSVGVVFQEYRLFDHLSARENAAFGLRARGASRTEARAAADTMLERFGVAGVAEQRPSTLSGGQAQRVALARALAVDPAVLLLDEPLAALDVSAQGSVRRELRRWIADVDACRILVSHDPVDAHSLADRVIVLEGGRVTQAGSLAELAAAPRSAYVADLMGTNIVRGDLEAGTFTGLDGTTLAVGSHVAPDGPVIATIRPSAIALHRERPEGSPRNVWSAVVIGVDISDGRVRVRLGTPIEVVVEVTGAGFAALDVAEGDMVWASVKASEISVVADG